MLRIMLYNSTFYFSYPTYKIMSISNHVYFKHFEFIFAALATLISTFLTKLLLLIHPNLTGHQSCENFILYKLCLLCSKPLFSYYAQNDAGIIGPSLLHTLWSWMPGLYERVTRYLCVSTPTRTYLHMYKHAHASIQLKILI